MIESENIPNSKEHTPSKEAEQQVMFQRLNILVDMIKFEAGTLWTIFNSFFIGINLLATSISVLISVETKTFPLLLILGIAGMLVNILWGVTFKRNSDWYQFRMNQAKKAEENYMALFVNQDWFLLNKDAEEFAKKNTHMFWRNNNAARTMIWTYGALYLVFIVWCIVNISCG